MRDAGRAGSPTVVVANGEEGEPASVKDRWLLRHRPHLVLDGVRLAARIVGADRAYVYVSDPQAADALDTALPIGSHPRTTCAVTVVTVDPGYVAGEETAAVRAINGGPAKPTDKPPRPFEQGVGGLPTLVSNVETLANLPFILRTRQRRLPDARARRPRRARSWRPSPAAAGPRPCTRYRTARRSPICSSTIRCPADDVKGVLMGGYFAGLLNREVLDATLDHETMRRLDSGLGCGAVAILTDDCPVAVAASVMAYFDRENAGQCGSCFNGTAAMAAVTAALRDGAATAGRPGPSGTLVGGAPRAAARARRWTRRRTSRPACSGPFPHGRRPASGRGL